MTLTTLNYVNVHGDAISVAGGQRGTSGKARASRPDKSHNGWRVLGLPPGSLEEAEKLHKLEISDAERHNDTHPKSERKKVPPPWDADKWMARAKKKAVRSKPYGVPEAAQPCREMAEKAGWLAVVVMELKRGEE